MSLRSVVTTLGAGLLLSCAVNPVTGHRELSLVSESQEIQMGRDGAESVVNTIGLYPDSSLQEYVSDLGMRLARASERPQLPWSYAVVNDPVVNAFALPGGFIFVTRGILAHLNSEAELVSVLGHETGHVTAKHSVSQISKAQLAQLGLGVGSILTPRLDFLHQVAGSGLQVLFLKFSRDDETQADDLGFRYMVRAGYDPRQATDVFETLDRVGGGGRIPEWQSTHPSPEHRVVRSRERAATIADPSTLTVGRNRYLRHIDGMVFGDNPREGYFEGEVFHHPDLRFRLVFPAGWKTRNLAQAVIAVSPSQDAIIQLSLVAADSPRAAAERFFSEAGLQQDAASSESIGGFPADRRYFTVATQQGTIRGIVAHVAYGGSIYRLLGYSTRRTFGTYNPVLTRTIDSFGRETSRSVLKVQPARIKLVKVPRRMTLEEFNRRYPSSVAVEQVALINGLEVGSAVARGTLVKRVVGGPGG